jgi:hypothetical protein
VIAAIILVVLGFVIVAAKHETKSVYVHGYTRKDGSNVGSYYRSHCRKLAVSCQHDLSPGAASAPSSHRFETARLGSCSPTKAE